VTSSPDFIFEVWCEAVAMAWSFCKSERLGELRGSRVKSFDGRGLHPYSIEWGRILACEVIFPELGYARYDGGVKVDMVTMRSLAHAEAYDEWLREQLERALPR
jgi:hypothetical protein